MQSAETGFLDGPSVKQSLFKRRGRQNVVYEWHSESISIPYITRRCRLQEPECLATIRH